MRVCLLAFMVSVCVAPAAADEEKRALAERICQLEERVAELERAVKLLQELKNQLPLTETERGLLGTWQTVDEDKTKAVVAAVKFNPDGTCDVVYTPKPEEKRVGGVHLHAGYRVVGNRLTMTSGTNVAGLVWDRQICTINETQLSWHYRVDEQVVTVRYSRVK